MTCIDNRIKFMNNYYKTREKQNKSRGDSQTTEINNSVTVDEKYLAQNTNCIIRLIALVLQKLNISFYYNDLKQDIKTANLIISQGDSMHLNNEDRNFLIMFYVVLLHVKTQEDLKKLTNYLNNFNKEEAPKINTLAYFQNLMNEEDRIAECLLHQVIHYVKALVKQSEPNETQVTNIYNINKPEDTQISTISDITKSDKNQAINLSDNDIIDNIYSFIYTSHSQLMGILFFNFKDVYLETSYNSDEYRIYIRRYKMIAPLVILLKCFIYCVDNNMSLEIFNTNESIRALYKSIKIDRSNLIYRIIAEINKDNTEDNTEITCTAFVLFKCSGKKLITLEILKDGMSLFRDTIEAKDFSKYSIEELSKLLDNHLKLSLPPKSQEDSDESVINDLV